MKVSPVVMSNYSSNYLNISVSLDLDNNICFVIGDSGSGKSFLYQVFSDDSSIIDSIVVFNYRDNNKDYKDKILNLKSKLIVIDNADILLDDELREYIAFDLNNHYIIFGRNPKSLFLTGDNFKEIKFENKVLSFINAF